MIREFEHIYRLYCHESQRVFHDRLVDRHDKIYFNTMLSEMSSKHFSKVSELLAITINPFLKTLLDSLVLLLGVSVAHYNHKSEHS